MTEDDEAADGLLEAPFTTNDVFWACVATLTLPIWLAALLWRAGKARLRRP